MPTRAAVLVALLLTADARADLCRRPDGSYTNQCSKSDLAVEGGTVSWADDGAARQGSKDATRKPSVAERLAERVDERYWRERLRQARKDLQDAESLLVEAKQEYGRCRARQRAALRTDLFDSCEQGQLTQAEHVVEEARSYMEGGIITECRRSSSCKAEWMRQ